VINNIASVGSTDLAVDYSTLQSIAADANALAAEVELILAANRLGLTNRTLIRNALASMPITTAANLLDRVKAAILLTMATPEYLVLR